MYFNVALFMKQSSQKYMYIVKMAICKESIFLFDVISIFRYSYTYKQTYTYM